MGKIAQALRKHPSPASLSSVASGHWRKGIYVFLEERKSCCPLILLVFGWGSLSTWVLLVSEKHSILADLPLLEPRHSPWHIWFELSFQELLSSNPAYSTSGVPSQGRGSLALSTGSTPHGNLGWLKKSHTIPYLTELGCPRSLALSGSSLSWLYILIFTFLFFLSSVRTRSVMALQSEAVLSGYWEHSMIRFLQN